MVTFIGSQIIIDNYSKQVADWCRENLVISNPEFAKKQRMGLWVGNTPKTIRLYTQGVSVIQLPFGCLRDIRELIQDNEIYQTFKKHDRIDFGGQTVPLYDYQFDAVSHLITSHYGILQSPAGSGKTQMGLALAAAIGRRTLWLTHTKDLLNQSMERAKQYFDADKFGTITEGKIDIGETITFATIQTMCRCDLNALKDMWDTIIVDECHRVAGTPTAVTQFSKVLNGLRARHKYGLSATVHRADGLIKATFSLLGPVVWNVPEEAVKEKIMPVTIQPQETGVGITRECLNPDGTINFTRMINYLACNQDRNERIFFNLMKNQDHFCLILSDRINHLHALAGMFPVDLRNDFAVITGKTPKAEREQALDKMRAGKIHYLFATYALAKEGLDIPNLDRLFLVTPQKDYAIVVQSVGRIARRAKGKTDAVVYDYVDDATYLYRAYKTRCRHYRKLNCSIEE